MLFLRDLHDGAELHADGAVDGIRQVRADHGAVRRDDERAQFVDGFEFLFLRLRRSGHTGQLVIEAEIILERDGGERLALALHLHALLGLDGLVKAVAVAAARHEASREFVDDDDLAVLHDVVDVALVDGMGAQRLLDVMHLLEALVGVDVLHSQELLHLLDAFVGERGGALLLVLVVMDILLQVAHERGMLHVLRRGLRGGLADDERRAGLIDENGIYFVDDGVVQSALDLVLDGAGHVVAQVVEAVFVVRAVRDVRRICLAATLGGDPVDHDPDRKAERGVEESHPRAVAPGEVVVHGDDVHAFSGQRIEVHGQRGDERLSFSGFHFGDASAVERDASQDLHVEGDHVPREGLASDGHRLALQQFARTDVDGERLVQNVIEGLACLHAILEGLGFLRKIFFRESADLRLGEDFAHARHLGPEPLELLLIGITQKPIDGIQNSHGSVQTSKYSKNSPFPRGAKGILPLLPSPPVPGQQGLFLERKR